MFRKAAAGVAADALPGLNEAPAWRDDYGTAMRDAAGVLTLAVESGSTAVDRQALAARVAAPITERPLSTQEQVWALLAAHALVGDARLRGMTLRRPAH